MNDTFTKITKGMSRDNVNIAIGGHLTLIDDIYNGNNFPHNWMCECGNIMTEKRWANIQTKKDMRCKECIRRKKYKYQIEKDGKYEYIKSFKAGETLPSGLIIQTPHIQVKHKYCGNIYEVQAGQFINVGKRCGKCCQEYENSFAYHIEVELGLKLEDIWDFEKNTVNPYHIYKGSNKKVWIKCQNEETNKLNGLKKKDYHGSSLVLCNNFLKGSKCPSCVSKYKYIHPYDSFGYQNFDKVMSWHPDNEISPFSVSRESGKRCKFICEKCSYEWSAILSNINKGKWCPICKTSKGERKIRAWLDKHNINYVHDEPYFEDLLSDKGNPLRPDFILPDYKIWIEYDGEFHYKDVHCDGSYELQISYDKRKDEYAKEYHWNLIRIKYTEFDNVESILNKNILYKNKPQRLSSTEE